MLRVQMRDRPLVTELSVVCESMPVKRHAANSHSVEIMWMNGGFTVDGVSAKIFLCANLARFQLRVDVDASFAHPFA